MSADRVDDEQAARFAQARAFLDEAAKLSDRAKSFLESQDWKSSLLDSRQSIEYSAKAARVVLGISVPKKHYIDKDTIETALRKIPRDMPEFVNYLRLFLLVNVWAPAHTLAQYPFSYEAAPKELAAVIKKEEAQLGYRHSRECLASAYGLWGIMKLEHSP